MDNNASTINIDNLLEAFGPQFSISSADFRTQYILASDLVSRFSSESAQSLPNHFYSASRIIEAILVGIPQPTLFFDGSHDQWIPINCDFFVEALCQFVANKFRLQHLYYLGGILSDRLYSDLPWQIREKLMNCRFQAIVLNSGVSSYSKFRVYDAVRQLSTDKDYSKIRTNLFPAYSSVLQQCERVIEQFHVSNVNKYLLERIILRILLYYVFSFSGKTDYPGTVESATNIILDDSVSSNIIDSLDITKAINNQSIEAVHFFPNHEIQDAVFPFIYKYPQFVNTTDWLNRIRSAWTKMSGELKHNEYTVTVFLQRIEYLINNLI